MEIILKEDVENLGTEGEVVEVADGYARNYLLPRRMAVEATEQKKRELKMQKKRRRKREEENREEAQKIADQLENNEYVFKVKAGEEGRLFGSVTDLDIVGRINQDGFDIEKKEVELDDHIKSLGVHRVPIKIFEDIYAEVKVNVKEEEE